jgi:uncharacterized phage protein (TIGR02220 family)
MASKDPAFLFYPSDFLTGTMFMNNEQIGIYIRLLCSQHQHGGIIDKTSFNSLVGENQLLRSKFIETETGFYNERLTVEMEKRNKKSNNMSETAKEVWARRKEAKNTIVSKKDTNVLQLHNNSNTEVNKNDTIVIQTVNVNEDVNIIIDYLNKVCNTDYKKNSKKTIEKVNARLSEKFTIEDFKLVIDFKYKQWGADENMKQYLRPETLFGSKFESYLQSSKIKYTPPKIMHR